MAEAPRKLERLKLLYDYTKFHIGLYGTLLAGFIAILNFGPQSLTPETLGTLKFAVFLLLIAAMSGGVVASSILDVYQNYKVWEAVPDSEGDSLDTFWETPIGPFNFKLMVAKRWWFIEHTAFWAAVLLVVGGFLLKGIIL